MAAVGVPAQIGKAFLSVMDSLNLFLERDLPREIFPYMNRISSPCFNAIQDQCSISAISLMYLGISNA